SRSLAGTLRFEEAAAALVEARRRAGISGRSELLTALVQAEEAAGGARTNIDQGDTAGYIQLAALAEDWGNVGLASELSAKARSQGAEAASR
ncbi:MAG: hypothetical protein VX498_10635, partial [Myxococcota bacterium]|nr:hypothetical protein [Myxococcota bacterium]